MKEADAKPQDQCQEIAGAPKAEKKRKGVMALDANQFERAGESGLTTDGEAI